MSKKKAFSLAVIMAGLLYMVYWAGCHMSPQLWLR